MGRAKVNVKVLDPIEQMQLEEAGVMAHFDEGKDRREIAGRTGLPLERVREIIRRTMAERENKFRGRLPKMVAAERFDRIARVSIAEGERKADIPGETAKLFANAIEAQIQLNKTLGLNAPVRTMTETTINATVVRREEQLLLMRDPHLRQLQSQADQRVINATSSGPEAAHTGPVRAHGLPGPVDLPAAPGDPQSEDDGAGDP